MGWFIPRADGTANQVIETDGAGALSFVTPSGGAWAYLGIVTATGAATVDFESLISATYDNYQIVCNGFSPDGDSVDVNLRVGTGGTPTYQTSAYSWGYARTTELGTASLAGSASDGDIKLMNSMGTDAVDASDGVINVFNANDASYPTNITWDLSGGGGGGVGELMRWHGGGRWETATAITALRVMATSGNISGVFRLYGQVLA
jgi:hypothetical protein